MGFKVGVMGLRGWGGGGVGYATKYPQNRGWAILQAWGILWSFTVSYTVQNGESYTYLILALLCLKNCKNLGMSTFKGRLRASVSRASAESSQIFCNAPKAPYNIINE